MAVFFSLKERVDLALVAHLYQPPDPIHNHNILYLVGSCGFSSGVCAEVAEFFFEFVMRSMAQTVDNARDQQDHGDAHDGYYRKDEELHRFRVAVLSRNLTQFSLLQTQR